MSTLCKNFWKLTARLKRLKTGKRFEDQAPSFTRHFKFVARRAQQFKTTFKRLWTGPTLLKPFFKFGCLDTNF